MNPVHKAPFTENVTVITGSSSGIGRELAFQLAKQRAWLTLASRDSLRLEGVAHQCREYGAKALAVPTDVSREEECRTLVDQTLKEYGRIDTLINNAGITMWARFDEIQDLSIAERVMHVNYFGSVYCTYHALPHLKETRGRIVGISSLTGKSGVPARSAYAASKHAMAGFFDSLRIELADSGVSVTMVYPDFVATQTRERALGPDGKPLGKSPVHETKVMTAETCARLILDAAALRRRQRVLSFRGRLGQWTKLVAPGLVDRMAQKAIERGR
jgi:short-subunit dehydrogenase